MNDNVVALVTGASRGIGKAIAMKFALEGFSVAISARNGLDLKNTSRMIVDEGGRKPLILPADLTDITQIPPLVNEVIQKWGQIDVLVNNAGTGYLKPFLEIKPDEFQQMMDLNVRAVFVLTQQVIPHMIQKKSGMVINIASLAGKNGFRLGTGYAASKWALRGFAQCLLHEVREHDIRVVTIFPGSVDTRFGSGTQSPTGTPASNKMQAGDIAEAAFMAYAMPPRTSMSEIDMRPSNPQKK